MRIPSAVIAAAVCAIVDLFAVQGTELSSLRKDPLRELQLDKSCNTPIYELYWDDLGDLQQNATELGYDESMWDNDEYPGYMFFMGWDDLTEDQQGNMIALDVNAGIYEDSYTDYWADELPEEAKAALEELGITENMWDEDGFIPILSKEWDELSDKEKDAAIVLGWDCWTWGGMEERASAPPSATVEIDTVDVLSDSGDCPNEPCEELDLFQCNRRCNCQVCPGKEDDAYLTPKNKYCPNTKSSKGNKKNNKSKNKSSKSSKNGGSWHCVPRSVPIARRCDQCAESCDDTCCDPGCFPQDATVEVLGKGQIEIHELEIGDKVRSASGYSEVYAHGIRYHYDYNGFLKFTLKDTKNYLETSVNHMLFVGSKKTPKLAANVKVGDMLSLLPSNKLAEVVSVQIVKKKGLYHPFTRDGTIAVNGVLASVHSVEGAAPAIKAFGMSLINMHSFQQMLYAPLRMLCKLSPEDFCLSPISHDSDGSHRWGMVIDNGITFLTYDSEKGQEANFLKASMFLPLKLAVVFWMAFFYFAESINVTTLLSLAVVIGTAIAFYKSPYSVVLGGKKPKKKAA